MGRQGWRQRKPMRQRGPPEARIVAVRQEKGGGEGGGPAWLLDKLFIRAPRSSPFHYAEDGKETRSRVLGYSGKNLRRCIGHTSAQPQRFASCVTRAHLLHSAAAADAV